MQAVVRHTDMRRTGRFGCSWLGVASVAWARTDDTLTVTATVPPGTRAEVDLPCGAAPVEVGAGTHTFTGACPPLSP